MVRKFFLFGFIALIVIGAGSALFGRAAEILAPGVLSLLLVVGGLILLLKK